MPPLLNLGYMLQPGTASQTGATQEFGAPPDSLPEHGTALHGVSAAHGAAAAAAASRAGSSLCGTLSGVSEVGTSGASDASLPLSGRPSPRQVQNRTVNRASGACQNQHRSEASPSKPFQMVSCRPFTFSRHLHL
jgi:hypothetical protein